MKRCFAFIGTVFILLSWGCATTQDLDRLRGELSARLDAADAQVKALKEENTVIRSELKKTDEALEALRKRQAETGADLTELRDTVRQLNGAVESLKKDTAALAARLNRKDDEVKDLREKIESVSFKTNFLENFLGIGKKEELSEANGKGGHSNTATKEALKGKADREVAYAAAYDEFTQGKYEKARAGFQAFLKQYPDTEYSDNAQFWIGECYYFEKKYEKAILEYEKVAKNYPEGNKVPYARLKQGLSFLNLGDKAGAKLILQQVIKDYPNTNQARIARSKLVEINQ
ncbi:MAG: tol-pal system protein YbgF [Deltaproteobacteria bacterium]|nr:tol-pal system protein YbgF [Deltaproteobacteria bacterium]